MAKLKAGTVANLDIDSLAGAMDAEFESLWANLKDTKLPDDPAIVQDRRLLFVAIARGLLDYLHQHRGDLATTEASAAGTGTEHGHQLEFDWE